MGLLDKYLEVSNEIKALTKLKEELRQEIGDLQLGSVVINDQYRISVSETRTFSPSLAKQLLTEEQYAKILKSKPDLTLAKRTIAPEDLELLYETKGQRWEIKERDDNE